MMRRITPRDVWPAASRIAASSSSRSSSAASTSTISGSTPVPAVRDHAANLAGLERERLGRRHRQDDFPRGGRFEIALGVGRTTGDDNLPAGDARQRLAR